METRNRIIQATSELFLQYGIKRVTMDEIANHLGISKKTIYQYFKDKDEIILICLQEIIKIEEQRIKNFKENALNAVELFIMAADHAKKMLRALNPTLLYDLEKYYPTAWKLYEKHRDNCLTMELRKSIEWGIEEGYFRDDINVEILIRMRIHQISLGFNQQIYPIHEFSLTEIQTEFSEHFMLGIATTKGSQLIHQYIKEKKNQITP